MAALKKLKMASPAMMPPANTSMWLRCFSPPTFSTSRRSAMPATRRAGAAAGAGHSGAAAGRGAGARTAADRRFPRCRVDRLRARGGLCRRLSGRHQLCPGGAPARRHDPRERRRARPVVARRARDRRGHVRGHAETAGEGLGPQRRGRGAAGGDGGAFTDVARPVVASAQQHREAIDLDLVLEVQAGLVLRGGGVGRERRHRDVLVVVRVHHVQRGRAAEARRSTAPPRWCTGSACSSTARSTASAAAIRAPTSFPAIRSSTAFPAAPTAATTPSARPCSAPTAS